MTGRIPGKLTEHKREIAMTKTELSSFQRRLVALARRLGSESEYLRDEVLGDCEAKVGATKEQYTTDDLSRERADEDVALSLLDNEEEMLTECLAALDRIRHGTFGRCQLCGQPISDKRLEAAPYARECIRCARRSETENG